MFALGLCKFTAWSGIPGDAFNPNKLIWVRVRAMRLALASPSLPLLTSPFLRPLPRPHVHDGQLTLKLASSYYPQDDWVAFARHRLPIRPNACAQLPVLVGPGGGHLALYLASTVHGFSALTFLISTAKASWGQPNMARMCHRYFLAPLPLASVHRHVNASWP